MSGPWQPPHVPPEGAFGDDFAFITSFLGPTWSHDRAMADDPTQARGGSVKSDRWYYYRLQYVGRREEVGPQFIYVNGRPVDIATLTPADKAAVGYVSITRLPNGGVTTQTNFYDPAERQREQDARRAADLLKERDQQQRFFQQRLFLNWVDTFTASYAALSTDLLFQRYEELRIQIQNNPPKLFDDTDQNLAAWQAIQKVIEKRRAEGEFAVGIDPVRGYQRLLPATAFNNPANFQNQQAALGVVGGVQATASAAPVLRFLLGPPRAPEPNFIDQQILSAGLAVLGQNQGASTSQGAILPPELPGVTKRGKPRVVPVDEPGGPPAVAPPRRPGFPDDFFAVNPPDP